MGSKVSDMASIDLPLVRAAALPTLTRTPGPLHLQRTGLAHLF